MRKILVIGSINIDLVTSTNQIPKMGETITGEDFFYTLGGKGCNQAVAVKKLGGDVSFLGAVGNDFFGKYALETLSSIGIDTKNILKVGKATGVASIFLYQGDNMILLSEGANKLVDINYIKDNLPLIDEADLILMQLEIPINTVEFIVEYAKNKDKIIILDPAPATNLSNELITNVNYLTPNQHELKVLFGDKNTEEILHNYPNKIVLTEGESGVRYHDGEKIIHVPAVDANVVDTTGAGDAFNGAFAVSILNNTLEDSIKYAVSVASDSTERKGAQTVRKI